MTGAKKTFLYFLTLLVLCLATTPAEAASRREAADRLEEFRRFFVDFQEAPDSAVPEDLLRDCYGIIIMSQFRAGFVFGGSYGEGVVLMHDRVSGQWSPPAFIREAAGNWGLQVGGQQTDAIVLVMNQDGVNMLLNSRFSIGVDASAAAGPVGRNAGAAVGPGTALLTYSRARGLFAGATLGGGGMFNNDSMNRALYGMPISVRDIIDGRVQMPPEAYGLINALNSYAMTSRVAPPPPPFPPQQMMPPPAPMDPYGPPPAMMPPMQPSPGAYPQQPPY